MPENAYPITSTCEKFPQDEASLTSKVTNITFVLTVQMKDYEN